MKVSKEIRIALVAIVAIVLLYFGMNFLKGMSLFSTNNRYIIAFQDVTGLAASSPIYSNGYRVGVVKKVNYDYKNPEADVQVEVDIDPQLQLPKGSSAEIVSDMLGNVQVNLLVKSDGTGMLKPGDVIPGNTNSGALGQLRDMIPAIEKILPKLDSIMGSLNGLLADPAIAQSLHHVEAVSGNLITTSNELNALMARLNKQMPGIVSKMDGVLDNATQLTGKLNGLDVETTMARVNSTLENVKQLTTQLNSNQGSLGLLMRDPQLYNNLNTTMRDVDSLLVNLKAHPKRYVHFSVFGKKDK